jgi:hypothetical protein
MKRQLLKIHRFVLAFVVVGLIVAVIVLIALPSAKSALGVVFTGALLLLVLKHLGLLAVMFGSVTLFPRARIWFGTIMRKHFHGAD